VFTLTYLVYCFTTAPQRPVVPNSKPLMALRIVSLAGWT